MERNPCDPALEGGKGGDIDGPLTGCLTTYVQGQVSNELTSMGKKVELDIDNVGLEEIPVEHEEFPGEKRIIKAWAIHCGTDRPEKAVEPSKTNWSSDDNDTLEIAFVKPTF